MLGRQSNRKDARRVAPHRPPGLVGLFVVRQHVSTGFVHMSGARIHSYVDAKRPDLLGVEGFHAGRVGVTWLHEWIKGLLGSSLLTRKGAPPIMAELAISEKVDVVAVPFHGDVILCVEVNGKPHVILKPAVEALGLDYWTQVQKLRGRSWATTSQRPVVAADGKVRDMVTCDVRTFLMLLANVDERRVGIEVQPKLIEYQAGCADAIEDYWTKSQEKSTTVVPRQATPAELLLQSALQLVEHERAIAEIRTDVHVLEARVDGIEQRTGWYTALGFSRVNKLPTDTKTLQRLGKKAAAIARRDGIVPAKAPNDSFGEVNMYPDACLREAAGLVPA